MSKVAPTKVLNDVYAAVCRLADNHKYILRDKPENSEFLNQLVKHPEVGKRLEEFISREKIRHWIKDVALNKYSKEKRQAPRDIQTTLKAACGKDSEEIEFDSKGNLSLHRATDGEYLLVARATYIKWETGVRKLLIYFTKKSAFFRRQQVCWRMFLLIHLADGESVSTADKKLLEEALGLSNMTVIWA